MSFAQEFGGGGAEVEVEEVLQSHRLLWDSRDVPGLLGELLISAGLYVA